MNSMFLYSKNIDNELRENDHTPEYGSAAKFVAYAMMEMALIIGFSLA